MNLPEINKQCIFCLEDYLEEISPLHERINNYISQLLSILKLSLNFEPFVNFYFSCQSFFLESGLENSTSFYFF